jgi:hypothetical protein
MELPYDTLQQLDFAAQLAASNTTKGRLIYYPPTCSTAAAAAVQAGEPVEWCGKHVDFSMLTGDALC